MSDFVYAAIGLDKENSVSFKKVGDSYIGYKVMQYDPNKKELISGADSRLKLPLAIGAIHRVGGAGIFLSNDPKYVVDYYSYREDPEDPKEVIIQYAFKLLDVVHNKNQLSDSNPEIGVEEAVVKSFLDVDDWHKGKRFK
jgi:hypothetical protein